MNDSHNMNVSASILAEKIQKWTGDATQVDTEIPGLRLSRWTTPTPPTSYTHNPSICLIAQGKKRVLLGEDSYIYDANHFLISSVNLPITANILEASEEAPYLGIIMELDLQEISQLIVDSELSLNSGKEAQKGIKAQPPSR